MPQSYQEREKAIVIKFGGSNSVDESGANPEYLSYFFNALQADILATFARAAFIIGGGKRVREKQALVTTNAEKDQVGIETTQEHARQMATVLTFLGADVYPDVPRSEAEAADMFEQNHQFAIALGGLKIGQSTDAVAVTAAELFQAQGYEAQIVILSNVLKIFTADPKTNPDALPIHRANIARLIVEGVLIDDPARWVPGMSATIDPIAVRRLSRKTGQDFIPVYFGHGQDTQSVQQFIAGEPTAEGTTLVDEDIETEYSSSVLEN